MFLQQYTNHKIYLMKLLLSAGIIIILCGITGCDYDKSSTVHSVPTPPIEDSTKTPLSTYALPSPTPDIAKEPSLETSDYTSDEEKQILEVKQLIEKKIDMNRYSLSILSKTFRIDHNNYIAFLAYDHLTPIEPIIIADSTTNHIYCLSKDGKRIPFINFPYPSMSYTAPFSSNGTYEQVNLDNQQKTVLKLSPIDDVSFKFSIHAKNSISDILLSGIGHIEGDYAVFTDESNHSLIFQQEEDVTHIYDDNNWFSKYNLNISGDYELTSSQPTNQDKISMAQAKKLLLSLSASQTGLPIKMKDYHLKPSPSQIIVGNRYCYKFDAYQKYYTRELLTQNFYVSLDGNVIFTHDVSFSDNRITTIIP